MIRLLTNRLEIPPPRRTPDEDFKMRTNVLPVLVALGFTLSFSVHAAALLQNDLATNNIAPAEEAVLLTPPPPSKPHINGPEVYGVRPGSPFLYRIPCTG